MTGASRSVCSANPSSPASSINRCRRADTAITTSLNSRPKPRPGPSRQSPRRYPSSASSGFRAASRRTWPGWTSATTSCFSRAACMRDGFPTYFWSDILYHRDKFEKRGFDRVVDVWGADHQGQVGRVKEALSVLGIDPARLAVLLVQLVSVKRGEETVRMSRRAGIGISLKEILDEVGPDAVRYFFLLRSADAQMEFDVDLARRQSSENPVYYAQYAHARLANG